MSNPPPPHNRRGFRLTIICALPLEAENVQSVFDICWEDEDIQCGKAEGDQNAYSTGMVARHNVVLAHMPSMGNNSASAVAAGLRSSFPEVKLVVIVGICGVVPFHATTQQEIILGDVIISTAVVQYDFVRQYPENFQRKRHIEKIWEELPLRFAHLSKEVPSAKYPGTSRDHLYEASYLHRHQTDAGLTCDMCNDNLVPCPKTCADLECGQDMIIRRDRLNLQEVLGPEGIPDHVPIIHFGRFGSANMVMKSGVDRDRIAKVDELIAFEMESAGVWDQYPTLVIKAACDSADSHKSKNWQDYAAVAAAACLKAFLKE
ncbi:hypothetical protein LTR84_004282 [Exophiala bonariae]|uniref:Nucleoside phosphorylase domain-containing protein n=1 Tax=Exophiala bonariae TaxID=1690606 RepID=A0AAV9N4D0_9EURO|nr:hypothetical protein LTR84_004282 [Exophiala bonariae]